MIRNKHTTHQDTEYLIIQKHEDTLAPVEVRLKANYTTGHMWFCQTYDESFLEMMSFRYEQDEHSKGYTGSGGVAIFTFKPSDKFKRGPHCTKIDFVHCNPTSKSHGRDHKFVHVYSV
eukprot:Nk52_evm49s1360 gene=Nk52_evmTU49s1360